MKTLTIEYVHPLQSHQVIQLKQHPQLPTETEEPNNYFFIDGMLHAEGTDGRRYSIPLANNVKCVIAE